MTSTVMRSTCESAVVEVGTPAKLLGDSIVISKGLVPGMRACCMHVGMLREDPGFLGEGVA